LAFAFCLPVSTRFVVCNLEILILLLCPWVCWFCLLRTFFFPFGFLEDFFFFGGERIAVTSTGGVCTLGLARSR
jgi:hypothetical protein